MNHAGSMAAATGSEPSDPNKVHQWVSSLVALDLKSGSISAEQAAEQFSATCTNEPGDAKDLPFVQLQASGLWLVLSAEM